MPLASADIALGLIASHVDQVPAAVTRGTGWYGKGSHQGVRREAAMGWGV